MIVSGSELILVENSIKLSRTLPDTTNHCTKQHTVVHTALHSITHQCPEDQVRILYNVQVSALGGQPIP